MHFESWQWTLLALGAALAGFSKTGVPGLGILFVALFANVMPARQATGVVLPLLITGDVCAVLLYRRHTRWPHLWRLFPATIAGVVLGWLALGRLDDGQTTRLVGAVLAVMLAVHVGRRRWAGRDEQAVASSPRWLALAAGLFAGFATQVANAAGPVMTLYLLAMRLPKLEFLGTTAVFFTILNWFKVPFMVELGLIDRGSLALNLRLVPFVIAGALLGRVVATRLNQRAFEAAALALSAAATVKLLMF